MNFIIEEALPSERDEIIKVLTPWNFHHIPSVEVEEIDFSCFYVAKVNGEIVGVCGYNILSEGLGKTTLLAVLPEFKGSGIGKALHEKRLFEMHKRGVKKVITNADRPDIILWYKKNFGYKEVGKIKKLISFGVKTIDSWTTIEMDLDSYMKNRDLNEEKKLQYINEHDPHPLSPYNPLIINVALTGVVPTKTSTPYVPISTDEIVEDAIRVYDAGASIVHLHARDKDGKPSSDARYYETIITSIRRERPDFICCVTTSGRGGQSFEARSEVLHLTGSAKPDMASLSLGSLNFLSGASVNSLETIQRLAMLMKEKGIKAEMEVFDSGMVNTAKYLERHQIIDGIKYFNILLGNLNTAAATIDEIAHISSSLPQNSIWAVAGLGNFQLPMNMTSIIAGGHVRVGIEDNIYYDASQTKLATNKELVDRLVNFSHEIGRDISTARQTRSALGLI